MKIALWIETLFDHHHFNPIDHSRAQVICRGNLLTIEYMIFYGVISYMIEFRYGVWIQAMLCLLFALAFILLKFNYSLNLVGNYIASIGFVGVFSLCYYSGGLNSPVLPWISLVPIVSLLFSNQRWA
ncbi:MAG: hypothetical protein ABIR66_11245, partial [Saprospiraceae bacterium]